MGHPLPCKYEMLLAMQSCTCQKAQLSDGQTVLDLGCGWGSFRLLTCTASDDTELYCQTARLSDGTTVRQANSGRAGVWMGSLCLLNMGCC